MFAFGDVKFGPGVLCCSKNGNKYNNEKKNIIMNFLSSLQRPLGTSPLQNIKKKIIVYIFC